jgi:hypothetical protein
MTTNHGDHAPHPTSLCAFFAPRLPLYCWHELDGEQTEAMRQHLASCDYCRQQLDQYEAAIDALRQGIIPDQQESWELAGWHGPTPAYEEPVRLTLEEIVQASKRRPARSAPSAPLPALPLALRHRTAPLWRFGPLAAMLVFTILTASLFAYFGGRHPAATAQPPIDYTTRAYLGLLDSYYVPWVLDYLQERRLCGLPFDNLPPARQTQRLPTCPPLLRPEVAAGETLIAQLATAHPPTNWQAAHHALQQAMQAMDAFDAQRLHAIALQNVTQYASVVVRTPERQFCAPVDTFNTFLRSHGAVILPQPSYVCVDI